ncbi:MAG TPA: hypothetical protein VNT20_18400 [Flavisolibacter sp.]|jgi:hypothetical protein|nr:hypothetical protein [Flavisolibacter sp.]
MNQETLNFLITIVGVAGLLIPTIPVMFRPIGSKSRVTPIGWAMFVTGFIMIGLGIGSIHLTRKAERHNRYVADSTRRAVDSLDSIKAKIYEDSLKSYHNYTTELLARYGLKVDTAQRRIEQIVHDSLRGTPDPVLGVADVTAKSYTGYVEIRLELISKDAPSKDFDVNVFICTSIDLAGPYINFDVINAFQTKKILATGDIIPQTFYFTKDANPFNLMFFLVKGTYKSIKDQKRRPIDALIGFNLISNTDFEILGRTETNLRNFFEESIKKKTEKKPQQIQRPIFHLRRPTIN